jgi:hypothetical protein
MGSKSVEKEPLCIAPWPMYQTIDPVAHGSATRSKMPRAMIEIGAFFVNGAKTGLNLGLPPQGTVVPDLGLHLEAA